METTDPEPTAAELVRAILGDLSARPSMEQIGPVILRHVAPVMRELRIAAKTWPCVCGHLVHDRQEGAGYCLTCYCPRYRPAPLTEEAP